MAVSSISVLCNTIIVWIVRELGLILDAMVQVVQVVLAERVGAVVVQSGRPVRVHREVCVALVVHAQARALGARAVGSSALLNARRAHLQRLVSRRKSDRRQLAGCWRCWLDRFDGFQDRNALCVVNNWAYWLYSINTNEIVRADGLTTTELKATQHTSNSSNAHVAIEWRHKF